MQGKGTKVSRLAARASVGMAAWMLLLSAAHSVGIKWPEEHDMHPAFDWLQTEKGMDSKPLVILGSSNVSFSLDCNRLDSICAPRKELWYNLGQRGMADFELLDYATRFVEQLEEAEVSGIYIEINARPILDHRPNWRRVQIMTARTIWNVAREKVAHSSTLSEGLSGLEQGLQSLLMKLAAPLHNWLYPTAFQDRAETKGFQPAGPGQTWKPRTQQGQALIEERRKHAAAFHRFLATGEVQDGRSEAPRVYPLSQLERLRTLCNEKGIALRSLCLSTERMAPWFNKVEKVLGTPPIVLGTEGAHRPFTDPQFLRDARHLNRRGTDLVSDQFAQYHIEQAP